MYLFQVNDIYAVRQDRTDWKPPTNQLLVFKDATSRA
jgi:hypothetical protein